MADPDEAPNVVPDEDSKTLPAILVPAIAGIFVLLFAGVWIYICVKVLTFTATPAVPTAPIKDQLVVAGGFLSTTVGAGTAAVLGVTIATVNPSAGGGAPIQNQSIAKAISGKLNKEQLLTAGILIYLAVGVLVFITWLTATMAPQVVETFALGILGWAAGAFSSVFKTQTTG